MHFMQERRETKREEIHKLCYKFYPEETYASKKVWFLIHNFASNTWKNKERKMQAIILLYNEIVTGNINFRSDPEKKGLTKKQK